MIRRAGPFCALLLCAGCGSTRRDPPPVSLSAPVAATQVIHASQGQPFTAACLIVQAGVTVEWRNLSPPAGIDMVSTAAPFEISSPVLGIYYNYVPADMSDECVRRADDGVGCAEALPFSYWRHTFGAAGVFDYHDGTGTTGLPTGSEYGMPMAPTSATAPGATGTVCVSGPGGGQCQGVCCLMSRDCAAGVTCVSGRCGGVTVGTQ